MNTIRPKAITTHHLQRRAIVYRRSAVCSPASLDLQIAQRDIAIGWGWPIDAITIIDDDGARGLDVNRPGYQRLIQLIEAEQVGLVLVTDFSRLSRSPVEGERFFALCQSTDTLLAINGIIVTDDVRNQRVDRLLQCIAALHGEERA